MGIIFLVIIGVLIYLFVSKNKQFFESGKGEPPLSILKKRYARGEITHQEYDKMKNDLES